MITLFVFSYGFYMIMKLLDDIEEKQMKVLGEMLDINIAEFEMMKQKVAAPNVEKLEVIDGD